MQNANDHPAILIIDDEPMMLKLLQNALQSEGYEAYLASNGFSGMSIYRDKCPNLVLLDILMPGPDGYEVLKYIRQRQNTPVIIITGRHDPEFLEKAFSLGADDFITKPFYPSELVSRVKAKLRRIEL